MMPRLKRWVLLVAAASAANGCGDREATTLTGPLPAASSKAASSKGSAVTNGDETVLILKRDADLPTLSTSALIGPGGGSLKIPRAGIRVEFAPGAVTAPTRITLKSLKGSNVAYEFQPHGLVFAAPVTIRQSLKHTAAARNEALASFLQGSYFEDNLSSALADATSTRMRVKENRRGKLNKLAGFLQFSIEHFSGYIVSVGKTEVEIDVQVEIR